LLRTLYFGLSGLALLVAALQFNDPDPVYWIAIYTATAVVAASKGLGRLNRFWTAIVIGGVVAGMLLTVSGFIAFVQSGDFGSIVGEMLASKPYVEESREFLGLALALAALIWISRD